MASAALWPSSAENILYFGVQKRLRAFLYPIFTGWCRGGKRHLQRRFLRKRGAAKNEPSQAHCVRQTPPFVTCGDIFPRSGGSLSSQGELLAICRSVLIKLPLSGELARRQA